MKRALVVVVSATASCALAVVGYASLASAGQVTASGNIAPQDVSALAAPTPTEDLYVPIQPCRIVDTHKGGGKISAGKYRSFYVRGTTGFPGQGGKSGGCGIPTDAVAIAASLTASTESGTGRITAYKHGGSEPSVTTLSYRKGVTISTGATLPLSTQGTNPHLRVHNRSASTYLAIDVYGYYVAQIQAVLKPGGGIYAGTSRVLDSVRTSVGNYKVTIDRLPSACAPMATIHGGPYFASAYISGDFVYATTYGLSGGTATPVDLYWTLSVVC